MTETPDRSAEATMASKPSPSPRRRAPGSVPRRAQPPDDGRSGPQDGNATADQQSDESGAATGASVTQLLAARDRGLQALNVHDAQRLLATRRRGLEQFDQHLADVDDRTVLGELSEAGADLLGSLEAVYHDEQFWSGLRSSEDYLDRSRRADLLRLREVLDHDLLEVLPLWGYRPPPSVLEFAERIQESLAAMLGPPRPEPGSAHRVNRAYDELGWFVVRMRRVLTEGVESARVRAKGPAERASTRVRVAAWVRQAAQAAVPAAVAAGAVGAVVGPHAGLAAGAAAAGTEGLKQLVEVAAADGMGWVLGARGLPEPEDLAPDLESAIDRAVLRVADVADEPPGDPSREAAVFLLRRALYRALQAESDADDVAALQEYSGNTLRLLRDEPLDRVVYYWKHGDGAIAGPRVGGQFE